MSCLLQGVCTMLLCSFQTITHWLRAGTPAHQSEKHDKRRTTPGMRATKIDALYRQVAVEIAGSIESSLSMLEQKILLQN